MKSTTTLSIPTVRVLALSAAVGGALMLAACGGGSDKDSGSQPQRPKPNPVTTAPTLACSTAGIAASNAATGSTVCMLTSDGEIVVELDARAPLTVANFQKYVTTKFYDNTIFHRVVPGFVAQGGGYTTGFAEKGGLQPAIKLETNIAGLSNTKYTIAMARTTVPDSATSQFFFNSADNSAALNYRSASEPGYAVFGKVISGQATVDKINAETQLYNGAETPAVEVLLYWAIQLK